MGRLFKRHFTVQSAQRQIPFLRRVFAALHRARSDYLELDRRLGARAAELRADLDGPEVIQLVAAMFRMQELLRSVERRGILIKDVDRGLVDLPALRDGQEVFLCWELSDSEIAFWHPLDEGYAGRQPL